MVRHRKAPVADSGEAPASPLLPGVVITHLGQGLAVETEQGEILLCHTRRNLGGVAVGDRVLWEPCAGGMGKVFEILPRRSLLTRPGYGAKIRPVAANLDRVYVVIAPAPEPDWLLADQYLAACAHRGLGAALVFNKIDRMQDREAVWAAFRDYETAGWPCFAVSAKTGEGLPALRRSLAGQCSMLAGQSGVGKSSLTNALLPERQLRTNELSEKSGLGRHTTTTATLYHLPDGGDLIDSPGVAVFGLAEMGKADVLAGYPEFRDWIQRCRFNDCRHENDKGCALREAVEAGLVSSARYRRWLKLVEKLIG